MGERVRIAVLADLHFGEPAALAERRAEFADILLLRAVHRLNRSLHPDLTVVLGDVIDAGTAPGAARFRTRLREVLGLLKSPLLVIPGNHDGDPEAFYGELPRPPDVLDVGPVRVVNFLDPEEPNFNARRLATETARLAAVRAGHIGPLVTLQHTPLFPPGTSNCPYNYLNAPEVLAAMHGNGLTLALSGHFHPGMPFLRQGSLGFLAAPALCEKPFAFLMVTIDGDAVSVCRHELAMPKSARLFDAHVHSPFAYCGENMDFGRAIALAEAFNLDGLAFSEHSGQLYYDNHTYWRGAFLAAEAPYPPPVGARMRDYLAAAAAVASPRVLVGLEADADFSGRLALRPEDRAQAQLLIGAIHQLPELRSSQPSVSRTAAEFLGLLPPLLGSGIQVLAHPFRVFRRAHLPVPEGLFAPTAELLRRHRVAAEINYHTNEPSEEFTRLCLRCGVRLCLGSDAHNLYEVGEFYQHLALLRACGVDGDLSEVLLPLGGSREGGDERERDRF